MFHDPIGNGAIKDGYTNSYNTDTVVNMTRLYFKFFGLLSEFIHEENGLIGITVPDFFNLRNSFLYDADKPFNVCGWEFDHSEVYEDEDIQYYTLWYRPKFPDNIKHIEYDIPFVENYIV